MIYNLLCAAGKHLYIHCYLELILPEMIIGYHTLFLLMFCYTILQRKKHMYSTELEQLELELDLVFLATFSQYSLE